MADVSKIKLPNNTEVDIKDTTARNNISTIADQSTRYNILPPNLEKNESNNGITVTVNNDDTVTVTTVSTGASANTFFGIGTVYLNVGDYYLLGGVSNLLRLQDNTDTYLDEGNGALMHITTSANYTIYLRVNGGYTNTSGIVVKPRIILKSLYDAGFTDYQPYALPNTTLTTAASETYDRCCSKNLYNWEKSYEFDNCYNVKGIYTTAGDTRTTLRFEIKLCNSSNVVIQNILENKEITSNGVYTWSFFYNGGATNFLIGHNGSKYNGRYRQPVKDLVVGAKYYISINITQATNNDGQFIWKDIMICKATDWNISHDYVPYNTLDSTTLPMAVKELSDAGGKKNLSTATGGTNVGAGYIVDNTAIDLPAGDYVFSWKNSVYTGGVSCVINCYTTVSGSEGRVVNENQVNSASEARMITVPKDCIRYNIYCTGANTITNLMICTKAQWDVSHTYQPYALSNYELTQQTKFLNDNITTYRFTDGLSRTINFSRYNYNGFLAFGFVQGVGVVFWAGNINSNGNLSVTDMITGNAVTQTTLTYTNNGTSGTLTISSSVQNRWSYLTIIKNAEIT